MAPIGPTLCLEEKLHIRESVFSMFYRNFYSRAATNETPGLRPTPSAPTSFGATTTEPTARTSPTPSCQWPSPSDTDSQTTWHTGNGSTTSSYVEGPSTTGTPGVPTYAARTQTADVQTRGRRREISHGTKSRSCYS